MKTALCTYLANWIRLPVFIHIVLVFDSSLTSIGEEKETKRRKRSTHTAIWPGASALLLLTTVVNAFIVVLCWRFG